MQKVSVCKLNHHYLRIVGRQIKEFVIFTFSQASYLICLQPNNIKPNTLLLINQQQTFLCSFDRYVSLTYATNLRQLLFHINSKSSPQPQWLAIYVILSFQPKQMDTYQVGEISYGDEIWVKLGNEVDQWEGRIVSNCFNQRGDYFYFVQNERENYSMQLYGEAISKDKNKIYGICLTLNQSDLVCVPFQVIIKSMITKLRIHPSIAPLLNKTAYLQNNGNYCTGTLISDCQILTVKHAFSSNPSKGATINVKLYPFRVTTKAILVTDTVQCLDAVILRIIDKETTLFSQQHLQIRIRGQFLTSKTVSIGQDILALGFGKYNYSDLTFSKVNLLLPTAMIGIVGKKLSLKSQVVMFKTDASLYNGFSGCAIWAEQVQIGMAAFCVKNITTSSQIYKQNYSYSAEFLRKCFINSKLKQRKDSQIWDLLSSIDNFTTRRQMNIKSKL